MRKNILFLTFLVLVFSSFGSASIIYNETFETDLGNWVEYPLQASNGVLSRSTAQANTGSYSMLVDDTSSGGFYSVYDLGSFVINSTENSISNISFYYYAISSTEAWGFNFRGNDAENDVYGMFRVSLAGDIYCLGDGAYTDSGVNVIINNWTHVNILVNYTGSYYKVYQNGVNIVDCNKYNSFTGNKITDFWVASGDATSELTDVYIDDITINSIVSDVFSNNFSVSAQSDFSGDTINNFSIEITGEQTLGFLNDSSNNNNILTNNGVIKNNYTAYFDGSSYFTMSDEITLYNGSIGFWYKMDSTTGEFFSKAVTSYDYHIRFRDNGYLFMEDNFGTSSTVNLNAYYDNDWHYMFINLGKDVYVDGNYVNVLTGGYNSISLKYIGTGYANGKMNGSMDEIVFFNEYKNSTEISEIYSKTYDIYTDNSLLAYYQFGDYENRTIIYSTTNGTIKTDILQNSTSLYNITFFSDDWFNKTYNSVNVSSNFEGNLTQSYINVTPLMLITNTSITNFSVYINGSLGCNTTSYYCIITPDEGVYIITIIDNTGDETYHTTSNSLTVNALDNTSFSPFVHGHELFVYARTLTNASITNFSATIIGLNNSDNRTLTTTTGVINFDMIHGTYNISVDADGYAITTNNYGQVVIDQSSQNYSKYFYLYVSNTVNISFYDSETLSLLSGVNVSVQFIGETAQTNITSTGNLYVELLDPSEYTLVFSADGYRQNTYIFTLNNKSFTDLDLYLQKDNDTSLVLITVKDIYGNVVKGSDVVIQRYINNAWITEQIRRTDFQGRTEGSFVLSTEFYNFLVKLDGIVYFGNINSDSDKKQIYAEDVANGIEIIINTDTDNTISSYQNLYGVSIDPLTYTNTSATSGYIRFFWDDSNNLPFDGNVEVFVNNVLANNCSTTSESAIIICSFNNNNVNNFSSIIRAVAYLNGESVTSNAWKIGEDDNTINWGAFGFFVAFIVVIGGFIMFSNHPSLGLFTSGLAFSVLIIFGVIFNESTLTVISVIMSIVLIVAAIKSKGGD